MNKKYSEFYGPEFCGSEFMSCYLGILDILGSINIVVMI